MTYPPLELAEAFIKAGELTDALDALNEHLTDSPDDAAARRLRVEVTRRLGTESHLLGALDDLDNLKTPADTYTRSIVLEALDDLPGALAAARTALAAADGDRLRTDALGRVLLLLRATGDLKAALELALEHDWIGWAADAALDLGDPQAALPYYDRALARADKLAAVTSDDIAANIRARVLLKRGAAHYAAGGYAAADADYTAAAALIPNDPMIAFNRGLIAAAQGRPDDATALFGESYRDAPPTLQEHMRVAAGEQDTALAKLWHAAIRAD